MLKINEKLKLTLILSLPLVITLVVLMFNPYFREVMADKISWAFQAIVFTFIVLTLAIVGPVTEGARLAYLLTTPTDPQYQVRWFGFRWILLFGVLNSLSVGVTSMVLGYFASWIPGTWLAKLMMEGHAYIEGWTRLPYAWFVVSAFLSVVGYVVVYLFKFFTQDPYSPAQHA